MDTALLKSEFLNNLVQYLTNDLFTTAIKNRSNMLLENTPYDTASAQISYKFEIQTLINDLSKLLGTHELYVARFNREPVNIQLFLYDRYLLIFDRLNDFDTFEVPANLPALFKWYFLTVWGD